MMMNVATIGGGTGSFQVLLALKRLNVKISALVSMSDDGGSTGILRTAYGILPPGDVRNCLVALSDNVSIYAKLFNYRFDDKLSKHNLGNLIITALTSITGSFEKALEEAHRILNVNPHEVIPITFNNVNLVAYFKINQKRKKITGESRITEFALKTKAKIEKIALTSNEPILPNPKAIKAILHSDFIVIAPGSLYTSILPNLVIPEIQKALKKTRAKKIFVVNIMSDAETYRYKVKDFVRVIEKYTKLDYIIVNIKKPSKEVLERYKQEMKFLVINNLKDTRIVEVDLLNEKNILRHDPEKLSRVLDYIFVKENYNL